MTKVDINKGTNPGGRGTLNFYPYVGSSQRKNITPKKYLVKKYTPKKYKIIFLPPKNT